MFKMIIIKHDIVLYKMDSKKKKLIIKYDIILNKMDSKKNEIIYL